MPTISCKYYERNKANQLYLDFDLSERMTLATVLHNILRAFLVAPGPGPSFNIGNAVLI